MNSCTEDARARPGVSAWVEFANRHPNGALYCFRGGLRSQIAQQWMHEAGTDFPVVKGGYKALRTFLLGALETLTGQCTFTLVGGMTGSGKTALVGKPGMRRRPGGRSTPSRLKLRAPREKPAHPDRFRELAWPSIF